MSSLSIAIHLLVAICLVIFAGTVQQRWLAVGLAAVAGFCVGAICP